MKWISFDIIKETLARTITWLLVIFGTVQVISWLGQLVPPWISLPCGFLLLWVASGVVSYWLNLERMSSLINVLAHRELDQLIDELFTDEDAKKVRELIDKKKEDTNLE